jgi:hypothetical protein
MRSLLLALACLFAPMAFAAAAPDESKSSGATLYEGLALLIADGAYGDDQIHWAQQAARAAEGNNWLEVSAQDLFNTWIEKAALPSNRRNWRSPEMFILLTALARQCEALDVSGAFPTSPTVVRSEVAGQVDLDAQAPALTRLAWFREETLWNRHATSPRSYLSSTFYMRELTKAVKARAQLTPRQWGQLTNFIPQPDVRPAIHRDYAPAKEFQPLLDALTETENFRPAAARQVMLSVLYYHKAWLERGTRYDQYTSDAQHAAFKLNLGLAYQALLQARQTAEAERCNLTPALAVVGLTGGGPRPGTTGGEEDRIGPGEFADECLRLSRSDRERAEIVDVYLRYCHSRDENFTRNMKRFVNAYGPESGVAIDALSYLARIIAERREFEESKEDWDNRRLTAMNKEMPGIIRLATDIPKVAHSRRDRLAFNGQFIDPKAYCIALFARYHQETNPTTLANLKLALAMPDSRHGVPGLREVELNGRHVNYAPQPDHHHRDRWATILLAERPSLESEWWGWPADTDAKVGFEASMIESWDQPGKLEQVIATVDRLEKSSPALSAVSLGRLAILKRTAEVTREFKTKGVLHLAWDDPVWRDKATHYYLPPGGAERKLNLGSHRLTITVDTSYSDYEAMELRAPLPQPYAIEFEFEHGTEMLPQKFPHADFISAVGIWSQDIVDTPKAMFTGIRTTKQPGGVYFTLDEKAKSTKPNLFPLPPSHPKANGESKGGKARVEVREGQVIWFLDGVQVFDSKKAGYPPMPMGLLRIGMLSSGYLPATATLGPPTITKLDK